VFNRGRRRLSQHPLVIETKEKMSPLAPDKETRGARFRVQEFREGNNPGLQWRQGLNNANPLPYSTYHRFIFVNDLDDPVKSRMRRQVVIGGNDKPESIIEVVLAWDERLAFYAAAASDLPEDPLVDDIRKYLIDKHKILTEAAPVVGRLLDMQPQQVVDVVSLAHIES